MNSVSSWHHLDVSSKCLTSAEQILISRHSPPSVSDPLTVCAFWTNLFIALEEYSGLASLQPVPEVGILMQRCEWFCSRNGAGVKAQQNGGPAPSKLSWSWRGLQSSSCIIASSQLTGAECRLLNAKISGLGHSRRPPTPAMMALLRGLKLWSCSWWWKAWVSVYCWRHQGPGDLARGCSVPSSSEWRGGGKAGMGGLMVMPSLWTRQFL